MSDEYILDYLINNVDNLLIVSNIDIDSLIAGLVITLYRRDLGKTTHLTLSNTLTLPSVLNMLEHYDNVLIINLESVIKFEDVLSLVNDKVNIMLTKLNLTQPNLEVKRIVLDKVDTYTAYIYNILSKYKLSKQILKVVSVGIYQNYLESFGEVNLDLLKNLEEKNIIQKVSLPPLTHITWKNINEVLLSTVNPIPLVNQSEIKKLMKVLELSKPFNNLRQDEIKKLIRFLIENFLQKGFTTKSLDIFLLSTYVKDDVELQEVITSIKAELCLDEYIYAIPKIIFDN